MGINNGDYLGAIGDFVTVLAGKDSHEAVVEVVQKEYFRENEVLFRWLEQSILSANAQNLI